MADIMKEYEVYEKGGQPPYKVLGTVMAKDGNDAIKQVRAALTGVYYPRDDCAARRKKAAE